MKRIRRWSRRIAGVFHTRRRDAELAAEIESHIQLHADENIRRGMSPEAARRDAVLKLGSVPAITEEYRARRGLPLAEQLVQDLRYAGRTMRRSAGVTLVAAVTLALGVAGPTVMFAMMKSWILDPLPFPQPESLVDIRMLDTATGRGRALNAADFLDVTRDARAFDGVAAYRAEEFRLTGADRAERVRGARVTPEFFRLLGAQPVLGRVFGPIDRASATSRVVVISRALWQDRFGGDAATVGRIIHVDGEPHTVIGVLPESFHFTLLGRVALWAPLVEQQAELSALMADLRAINERMWDVQDALRAKEAAQAFDAEFVELARSVARHNGDRIQVKNTINRLAGSRFIEEKQYQA